jgi:hypothetical protein
MRKRKTTSPRGIPGFLTAADAIVPCGTCKAAEGKPCTPVPRDKGRLKPGYVHIARRVKRLLLTARGTSAQREDFERKAVEMLREWLLEKRDA